MRLLVRRDPGARVVTFTTTSDDLGDAEVDLLVVAATSRQEDDGDAVAVPGPGAAEVAELIDVDLADELAGLDFDGSAGATARIPTRGRTPAQILLVVGLGPENEIDAEALRRAGAAAADATERLESLATAVHLAATDGAAAGARAVAEGIALAAYRFDALKSDPTGHALRRALFTDADEDVEAALEAAAVVTAAVVLARDLVNLPPGRKRPPDLAERARDEVADLPVEVRVLAEDELEEGGYGGLLGVGSGSDVPPRLVEMTYAPDGADRHVALVGKGITFDSGGLSLKTSDGMMTMKMDMAGAAGVLATLKAAAALGLGVHLTGLMALAENMPSGTAIRPGDVLTTRSGKTIEVLNTDAEGRLVLADALGHASELEPDVIVDMATLTGAAVVALGPKIGALMSTDDDLAEALLAAGTAAGETLWRLPVASRQYGEELKGDVGDVKNSGWKGAGTIRAGLFLHEFVDVGIPWAHLDIAGIAWTDSHEGYQRKGGTGAPVRTLVEWLRTLA